VVNAGMTERIIRFAFHNSESVCYLQIISSFNLPCSIFISFVLLKYVLQVTEKSRVNAIVRQARTGASAQL